MMINGRKEGMMINGRMMEEQLRILRRSTRMRTKSMNMMKKMTWKVLSKKERDS
jgi:hypothetical protein